MKYCGSVFDYSPERNCFSSVYVHNIVYTDTTSMFNDVTIIFSKEYNFNEFYDIDTELCIPQESVTFMVQGKDPINIEDFIFISEPTGATTYAVEMPWQKCDFGKNEILYIGEIKMESIKDFVESEKAFDFMLMHGPLELYLISLSDTEVKEIKKIMQYDLYEDDTQVENIRKAVEVRKSISR